MTSGPGSEVIQRPPVLRPPLVALALLLVAWGFDVGLDEPRVVPWPWAGLGAALVAGGVGLAAWALGLFTRAGTTHDPRGEPTRLVVSGPYRLTRNPMYVAITAILLGIGILVGTTPFLVLPPLGFVILMNAFYIPREERMLERVFGAEYEAFRARVRRWL